jgi:hypothetical protein
MLLRITIGKRCVLRGRRRRLSGISALESIHFLIRSNQHGADKRGIYSLIR